MNKKPQQQAISKIQRVLSLHGIPEREIEHYLDEISLDINTEPGVFINSTDEEVFKLYKGFKEMM